MSQHLPVRDFNWIDNKSRFGLAISLNHGCMRDFNVMSVPDDDSKGYILEVDLGMFCVCVSGGGGLVGWVSCGCVGLGGWVVGACVRVFVCFFIILSIFTVISDIY